MPKKLVVELALLNKLTRPLDKAKGKIKRIGFDIKKSFMKASKAVSGFMNGLNKVSSKIVNFKNLVIAAAASVVTKFFIDAASSIEIFAKQLEVVTGSATKAGNALTAIREFARTSPLETEDVVQAYVRLRAVGIDPTIKQMRTIGGVAVLMNREMTDVLDSLIGLNKRTLRQLGIDIDRTGQKAVIQSGNVKRVVEKDSQSIRGALLEIWEERFPNAIETAANTTKSKTAIMKSNVFELAVVVGNKLKPAWEAVVETISKAADATRKLLTTTEEEATVSARRQLKTLEIQKASFERMKGTNAAKRMGLNLDQKIGELAQKITEKRKEILSLTIKEQSARRSLEKDIGTGSLGTTGVEDETKRESAAKKLAKQRLDQYKFEARARRESAEAIKEYDSQLLESERMIMDQRVETYKLEARARKESAEAIQQYDKELFRSQEELALKEKKLLDDKLAHGMRLGSAMSNLARVAINESKANAREKKNMLRALAIAEAAAAAVMGIRSAMDLSFPYNLIAAAATVAEVAALAAVEISSINSASFARGTSFAPGGMSLVGERGPELVNLPRGSQVYNNTETRQMVKGANISIPITINGNASNDTVSNLRSTLSDFAKKLEDGTRLGNIDWRRIGVATI